MQEPSVQEKPNGHAAPQDQSTTAVHSTAAEKTLEESTEVIPRQEGVGNHDNHTQDQTIADCSSSKDTDKTEELSVPNGLQLERMIEQPQEPATATENNAPGLATPLVTGVHKAEEEVGEAARSTSSHTQPTAPTPNSQKVHLEEINHDPNSRKISSTEADSVSPGTQNDVTPGAYILTVRFHRDGDIPLAAGMLEDDHFALYVLFKIVHYHYYDMPKRPTVDQFHSICVVASKYDCTHLFVPYMKEWIVDLDWQVIMASDRNDDEKTLWITWIFGDPKWFWRMLRKVAQKTTLDSAGNLLNSTGHPWKDLNLPAQLLDLIAATRENGLKAILEATDLRIVKLMKAQYDGKCCRVQDADEQLQCNAIILGSAMTSLVAARLWPLPQPKQWHGSVAELAAALLSLKIQHYTVPGTRPHLDSHGPCGLGHQDDIRAVLEQPVQLSRSLAWALTQQAIKSGAFDAAKFEVFSDFVPPIVGKQLDKQVQAQTHLVEEDVLLDIDCLRTL